jgi:hypothetical protein
MPPVQVPAAPVRRGDRDARRAETSWDEGPGWNDYSLPQPARSVPEWPVRPRRPAKIAAIGALVLVAVVGASAAAVHYLNRPAPAVGSGRTPPARSSPAHGTTVVTPVSASGFDPLAKPGADPQDENSSQAPNVLDGNPSGWSTQQYVGHNDGPWPTFGNLKAGTGLILDLGRSVPVASVTVTFGNQPGANVEIKAGSSNTLNQANLGSMRTLASASNVSGSYTFTVRHSVPDQYLVIWFTQLPPLAGSPGQYAAQIFNVVVKSSS